LYAVVDTETTGLWPGWHDRIIEVAVVQLNELGKVEREWCTLLNPNRDLGPQRIHGIRTAEVIAAPAFADIAGHLVQLLAGRVLVAHNLGFDTRFLLAEYGRIGAAIPLGRDSGLCTMALAGQYLPGAGRSLADCCMIAGIRRSSPHSALDDAHSAAALLAGFIEAEHGRPPWTHVCAAARAAVWPLLLPAAAVDPVHRTGSGQAPAEHFASRLVARLPRAGDEAADEYLDLLDRCLLDRDISATETRALVSFAAGLGIGGEQVTGLHRRYLATLATAALADAVVTPDERDDLADVARLLGLEPADVDRELADAQTGDAGYAPPAFRLQPGDHVVFAGELAEPREVWEARATALGLVPRGGVSKKTKLVVAADPDTLSGKAKKAWELGVPLVDTDTFLRLARAAYS
jgi:DNA polymerase-3 subunit epsilon